MNIQAYSRRNLVLFLIIEGILYITFLMLDIFLPYSGWDVPIKYTSILLCFFGSFAAPENTDGQLTRAALFFTLLADLFLLVLDRWYLIGVASFCVVQLLYLTRIHRTGNRPLSLRLLLRAALAVTLLALGAALDTLNPLTILTLIYFSQLAANFIASLSLGRAGWQFALGLLLFMGCDICVGLCNLATVLPEAAILSLLPFAQVGMWLFYLPSQVLITLSAGKLRD